LKLLRSSGTNFIKTLVRYKVYFDRSRMYIGYIQFIILLLVLFEAYSETKFGVWFYSNIAWAFPVFLVLFFAGSIVLGYLDKRFIRPHEQSEVIKTNPVWMDMYRKICKIEEELKK